MKPFCGNMNHIPIGVCDSESEKDTESERVRTSQSSSESEGVRARVSESASLKAATLIDAVNSTSVEKSTSATLDDVVCQVAAKMRTKMSGIDEQELTILKARLRLLYLLPSSTRRQYCQQVHEYMAWATKTFGACQHPHVLTPQRLVYFLEYLERGIPVRVGMVNINVARTTRSKVLFNRVTKIPRANGRNIRVCDNFSARMNLVFAALGRYWDLQCHLARKLPVLTETSEYVQQDGIYTLGYACKGNLNEYASVALKRRQLYTRRLFRLGGRRATTLTVDNPKKQPEYGQLQENESRVGELVKQLQVMHDETVEKIHDGT